MGALNDLTGMTFGRLKVVKRSEDHIQPSGKHVVTWECQCSCDKHTTIIVEGRKLTNNEVVSCGCLKEENKKTRIGEENKNRNGCLMKIIEYNKADDIIVEFQDEYKSKVKTRYGLFKKGSVRNPYHTSVYNIGIIGNKYPIRINGNIIKEYQAWHDMMQRCFSNSYRTYEDVTCCDEWLLYENFYEWLHSQENFNKWLLGDKWAVDKDILIKGNKVYSPKTCCLVPHNVNSLFVKRDMNRGNLPIGVSLPSGRNKYLAHTSKNDGCKSMYLGFYDTIESAFNAYKKYKEQHIKNVAKKEFDDGNITLKCYTAMMNYKVEITD